MSLLCSITKASANAVPAIRSPQLQARLRQRDQPRPRFASVNSGGGAGISGSGEFYRLPWYRRPLPSNRRTSVAGGESELKRRNSMVAAPRAGLRPPRGSSGAAVAPATTVGGRAASSCAAEEDKRALGNQQQQQQLRREHQQGHNQEHQQEHQQEQVPAGGGAAAQVAASVVDAENAEAGSPPAVVPLRRSTSSVGSSSSAFEVAADTAEMPERAAAKGVSGSVAAAAPAVEEVDATPAANYMAADRDDVVGGESPSEQIDVVGVAKDADELASPPEDKNANSEEVLTLRAEVHRLKREMASVAAAAAKDTTTPPTAKSERGKIHRPSPKIEVSSPNLSSVRSSSMWEWDPTAVGTDDSFDAGRSTRPMSARLRADNSWMHRRHSGESGQHSRQGSSADFSASNGAGFGGNARAGSVLPAPGSDGARRRNRAPSDEGAGDQGPPGEGELLLSPPASVAKVEGPSPASGEKGEEAKAPAAADGLRRLTSGVDSIEEDSGGSESSRSNSSVRQMSVFFPVQQQPPEPSAAQATSDSRAVAAEGAAALARAAATQIGATASPPEAARAAQAARDAFAAKQQLAAARQITTAPVVHAKVPVVAGASCAGRGCRWHSAGGSNNGGVWRWVLAQRTGNQTVRQAVISHGLPLCGRRHIWAAWATIATPEK